MPHDQCPMAEVVSGKLSEVRDAEVLIERPDGSRITVVVNIRPQKNQQGEAAGAINCFYDITERKRTEEALRESDRRKDDFLAALGHELRNPFAAITTAATLLEQRIGSDATAKRPLDVIARQARHVARLWMISWIRHESDGEAAARETDNRSQVAGHRDHPDDVGPNGSVGRTNVSADLGDIPLYVEADPIRLAQVFTNLIDNASKFTPDGGRISVAATAKEGESPSRCAIGDWPSSRTSGDDFRPVYAASRPL